MATYFGEIRELESRAVDFDELDDQPTYNLTAETSANYTADFKCDSLIFCAGDIAKGFSSCYLFSDNAQYILNIYYTSESNENDSLLYGGNTKTSAQNKASAASLYYIKPDVTVCEVSSNIPETLYAELLHVILQHVQCSNAVVLTSAPLTSLKGNNTMLNSDEPNLMCLTTSAFNPPLNFNMPKLPSPNFVAGIPAAVLTEFEIQKKPAICVVSYIESNIIDFANIQSFENIACIDVISKIMNRDCKSKLLNYVNKQSSSNLYV